METIAARVSDGMTKGSAPDNRHNPWVIRRSGCRAGSDSCPGSRSDIAQSINALTHAVGVCQCEAIMEMEALVVNRITLITAAARAFGAPIFTSMPVAQNPNRRRPPLI